MYTQIVTKQIFHQKYVALFIKIYSKSLCYFSLTIFMLLFFHGSELHGEPYVNRKESAKYISRDRPCDRNFGFRLSVY